MNNKTRSIYAFFSFALLLLSFFLGFLFAMRVGYLSKNPDDPLYIDIKTSTKSIQFESIPEKVKIRVNGEIFESGSLSLEK